MKKYRIKPEFVDLWGDVPADNIITEDELNRLSVEWETPVEELLNQLEEV